MLKMSAKNDKSDLGNKSHSDSAELFDNIYSEPSHADASNTHDVQPDLPSQLSVEKDSRILESDVKDVAVKFWNYLKKDSKDTFLDADIKDVNRAVLNFLNKDVVGQKIVLLEDEKLRTANVVARALKRKRRIIKEDKQKSTIVRIKKIYKYLHNPFWDKSLIVGKSRKYLDKHLRRMTPAIIKELTTNVEKLQEYFNGIILDQRIFASDISLKQMSMKLGYKQFAVCEKHQQVLVKNELGDVLCMPTDCFTGECPFEAGKAHGEETDFLLRLGELLTKIEVI
jgi:hypothetical protein